MIYHHLFNRTDHPVVTAAVIGAGQYSTAVVTQAAYTPGLTVRVVADINLENAIGAYLKSGLTTDDFAYADTAEAAQAILDGGGRVVTDRADIVALLPAIDIVCEGTGIPEASARYARDAIAAGKHVAMVTKDTDVTVGPELRALAVEAGVVYTPVDGDQHGLLVQLVEWAKLVGLDVIAAGKATDGEYIYDPEASTVRIHTDKKIHAPFVEEITVAPEDRKWLAKIPEGESFRYIEERRRILARLPQPGSYDLCEMAIAANYLGFAPQVDTLEHAPLRITEIPVAYALVGDGGIYAAPGAIDLATCLRTPDESGLGGGVWITVRAENEYSNHILTTKGQIANADGTATVIYRPYHLCGVETSVSLLAAVQLGVDTGAETYRPHFDLIKVAAHDIKAGDVFGNDHSPQTTARIVPAARIAADNAAAAHLLTGNRATRDIPAGTVITYDMVERPEASALWELREQQDDRFELAEAGLPAGVAR
ncbi:putative homoserine dehydrogenase-like protein [Microbacterium terrae]|uniref:SAF domain protein n=1 Tax=Microbacterium terrae TaxID=69369 RepID=A0A0M2HIA5_9MICO|nr:SAF domain-containing protein [Microbacterium terrae]KJL44033.1 SAF domain protein [Microbacterium terrae]MBP1079432.1 putative homoserine dehydrogenase-like protein [Microbacterium terrae]GLJ98832.1 flagellar protein FlgA [Microbacterium terrae]